MDRNRAGTKKGRKKTREQVKARERTIHTQGKMKGRVRGTKTDWGWDEEGVRELERCGQDKRGVERERETERVNVEEGEASSVVNVKQHGHY